MRFFLGKTFLPFQLVELFLFSTKRWNDILFTILNVDFLSAINVSVRDENNDVWSKKLFTGLMSEAIDVDLVNCVCVGESCEIGRVLITSIDDKRVLLSAVIRNLEQISASRMMIFQLGNRSNIGSDQCSFWYPLLGK